MKTMKKLLVSLMAFVMLFGASLTVYAAGNTDATVAAITNINAKTKNVTFHTNDNLGGSVKIGVDYQYVSKNNGTEYSEPAGIRAQSADRGVVKVVGFTDKQSNDKVSGKKTTTTVTQQLNLQAVGNGKTTVTITDRVNPKKKVTITVTVKTLADDIEFSSAVEKNEIHIARVKGSSINLGAYITNSEASDKKITYAVDKSATKMLSNTDKTNISVDKNGNVKVSNDKALSTVIKVSSNDKRVDKFITVIPDATATATSFTLIQDTKTTKETLGMLNKSNVLPLKGNRTSEAHTYLLNWKENTKADEYCFTSSNPSVASVDDNGKITAKANGTAKITITTKAGNPLKNVKPITVKVTTDVTYVGATYSKDTVLANNKDSVKIVAKTNTNASNKNVKYEVMSVTGMDGQVDVKQIKNYISVDKNGVVKAKKACEAQIRAYAVADTTKERVIKITANTPVTSLALGYEGTPSKASKNAYTIYRKGSNGEQDTLRLVAKVNDDASECGVIFTSSNEKVATVDELGNVTATGTGSAKITAKAVDGSGKSATATVTVKTDAYEINTNADNDRFIYVEGNDDETKATTFTLSKVINATTNKDASVKTVKYYQEVNGKEKSVSSVKLKMDEIATITIKATDARTHDDKTAKADPVTETVTIVCYGSGGFTKDIKIEGLDEEAVLATGDSMTATANVTAENPNTLRKLPNGTKITWVTSNKKVATVDANGVVTAKGTGKAIITAKCQGAKSAKMTVYVGRNREAVEKEIEALLAEKVKSENRDWTGIRTNFDEKNNAFDLAILKPNKSINTLEDTGVIEALKSALLSTSSTLKYKKVAIKDTITNDTWTITVDGVKTTVVKNNDTLLADVDATEAIEYVSENVIAGADRWKDWNGKTFTVTLSTEDTQKYDKDTITKTWEYDYAYDVAVSMDAGVYEAYIDEMTAKVKDLVIEGVEEVTYDANHNATDMVVGTAGQSIKDAYDAFVACDDNMNILKSIYADATEVTLTAELDGKEDFVTKAREGASDEYIKEVFAEYVDKLIEKGVTTLDGLDGAIMTAKVTFTSGNVTYTGEYEMNISLAEGVFESAADARIAEAVKDTDFAFGSINYDEKNNVITVSIKKEFADKKALDLGGTGVKTVLASLVDSQKASKAVVITPVNATTIDVNDNTDEATQILTALAEPVGKDSLSVLDATEATIKVTYVSNNGASKKTLTYTVVYDVAEEQDKAPVSDVEMNAEGTTVETIIEEITVEETTVEETTVEETTVEEITVEETTVEETTVEETAVVQ